LLVSASEYLLTLLEIFTGLRTAKKTAHVLLRQVLTKVQY